MPAFVRAALLTILACGFFGAAEANAASFDCANAASLAERTICDDHVLDALDSHLAGAFQGALDRSNRADQLRRDQVAWLRTRDAAVADPEAMQALYRERIEALLAVNDAPPGCPGSNTIEMNECDAAYVERANRELARYVAAARKQLLDEAKEDPERTAPKEALKLFDDAQSAWTAYSVAECGGVYAWFSEGTIRGSMELGCRLRATKARTAAIYTTWLTPIGGDLPSMPPPSPAR